MTHDTIAYLQLEEWKNDMNEEINSINQILSKHLLGMMMMMMWGEGQGNTNVD